MTHDCICAKCGKVFQSQKMNSVTCYWCALEHFAGGRPPEEGDFNSASLLSGEMSDEEARELQKELESVDHSGNPLADYYDEADRFDNLDGEDFDD
ncbi:MAG TPA: hypothetical protein VI953_02740 [Candidatus Paceibacterota bacterium]